MARTDARPCKDGVRVPAAGLLSARAGRPAPSGGGMKARNEEPRHACGFLRLRRLRSGLSRDTLSQCEKRKRLRGVATARTRPRSPPPLGGWETHPGSAMPSLKADSLADGAPRSCKSDPGRKKPSGCRAAASRRMAAGRRLPGTVRATGIRHTAAIGAGLAPPSPGQDRKAI